MERDRYYLFLKYMKQDDGVWDHWLLGELEMLMLVAGEREQAEREQVELRKM